MNITCPLSHFESLHQFLLELQNSGIDIPEIEVSFDLHFLNNRLAFISKEGSLINSLSFEDISDFQDFTQNSHPISVSLLKETQNTHTIDIISMQLPNRGDKSQISSHFSRNKPPKSKISTPKVRNKPRKTTEKQNYSPEDIPKTLGNYVFQIEDHKSQCKEANRPAVFAIKYLAEDQYEIYYRTSVYETHYDKQFRDYLDTRPGTLISLHYFKKIESLKGELKKYNKALRHNGKNILSSAEMDELLRSFSTYQFL